MKTIKSTLISIFLLLGLLIPLSAAPAYAQCTDNSPSCGGPSGNTTSTTDSTTDNCSDTNTGGKVDNGKVNSCLNQNKAVKDIQLIVNFLSAAVGIVIIAMIIVGGIQYTIAGDNANAQGAAKTRITNALIALFAFIFAFAFLQWLIPGGIFS